MIAPSNFVNKAKSLFSKYPEIIAFLILSLIILWLNLGRADQEYYYDAWDYWNLRLKFDRQNTAGFSLINYDDDLRAYLLPLLYYSISKAAMYLKVQDMFFLEGVQAVVFSAMVAILIPRLTSILFKQTITFWQIILLSALVVFFWQGYFYYPLSDFWSFFFILLGIYVFLRYRSMPWILFLVGACWGAAFLIRPSYLLSAVLLLFWATYYLYKCDGSNMIHSGLRMIILGLGLITLCLPQLIINMVHFNQISFMPQTQLAYGTNLFVQQLNWGIETQRYETFVGNDEHYPFAQVVFADPHGTNILIRAGVDLSSGALTLPEYIGLVFRHPFDFLVLYLRHLFNGLDIVYNTPYISDLYHKSAILFRLVNYSLWFIAILFVNQSIKAAVILGEQFLLLLILTSPSVLSIPTAIEIRFMLPFYFIMYSVIAFGVLPLCGSFTHKQRANQIWKYLPWYIVFVSICLALSSNTFSNLKHGTYIFW